MMRLICGLFMVFASTCLQAHGLLMKVASEGSNIVGTAYFTNGEIAVRQDVELLDLDSPALQPVPAITDMEGKFRFPAVASHRYRVSVFGEEGHEVQMEIVAGEATRAHLIENNGEASQSSFTLPAWAVIGGLLLLSLIPAFLMRKKPDFFL